MRALIVDDDHICRTVLQHALAPYGAIAFANDGLAALAEVARSLALNEHFDLITLDIMMPEIDGQQTLKGIRRLESLFDDVKPARIAMTSALDDKGNIFSSFREQADLYFVKPLKLDQVIGELKKANLVPA